MGGFPHCRPFPHCIKRGLEMTLPRNRRLRGSMVQRILNSGRKVVGPLAVLYWHPVAGGGPARAAVVAGRRLGGAVVRNRLRRLFKEAFRRRMNDIPGGLHLVFVVRGKAVDADFRKICRAVDDLLLRAGLMAPREPGHGGRSEEIRP